MPTEVKYRFQLGVTDSNIAFHGQNVFLSPLLNYVPMVPGAETFHTGRELLGSHVNHNTIGLRQRYITAMYVDSRQKKLVSDQHYGGKVQIWEYDELISRFGAGTPAFMLNVLRTRLAGGIVGTHEKIAKQAIFDYSIFRFLANGDKFAAGTADFSDLTATSSYQINIKFILQSRLRSLERSRQWLQQFGDWGQPVPGSNDTLIMTTPHVMYDLWASDEGKWMEDLRGLQDYRIINGGEARYMGATFVDNPDLVLWNAGVIGTQVGVTEQIKWGDGAPDPDTEDGVDAVYFVGQSSANITHYVQCSDFSSGDFEVGDRVSIHVERTGDWGVTNGVNFLDGKTYEAIVWEVDASANTIKFTEPIVEEYDEAFTGTPNGGSEATLYAYITKARHIHPILVVNMRGMATFAARRKVRLYNPPDVADLPQVTRVTWDEYGAPNRWNPYIYELIFCVATDTRSGRDKAELR